MSSAPDIQASVFFCEDMRVEEGGKPMVLGFMASTIYAPTDVKVRSPWLITTVRATRDIEQLDLVLNVTQVANGESHTTEYKKIISRTDDDHEEWSAFLPVELDHDVAIGDSCEAVLTCSGHVARATLKMVADEEDEATDISEVDVEEP